MQNGRPEAAPVKAMQDLLRSAASRREMHCQPLHLTLHEPGKWPYPNQGLESETSSRNMNLTRSIRTIGRNRLLHV